MSEKDDGGAAFPALKYLIRDDANDFRANMEGGLSLRDYFAAKAMGGMLADPDVTAAWEDIAKASYKMADAMLAAREAS